MPPTDILLVIVLCLSIAFFGLTVHFTRTIEALLKLNRFGGGSRVFYSVAEHSIYASHYITETINHPIAELLALLHDAAEAYFNDIVRPVKSILPGYRDAEKLCHDAILKFYGLDTVGDLVVDGVTYGREAIDVAIRNVDNRLLHTEKLIMQPGSTCWGKDLPPPYTDRRHLSSVASALTPHEAGRRFHERWQELVGECNGAGWDLLVP